MYFIAWSSHFVCYSLANQTVKFHDPFLLPLHPLHSVLYHKFLFVLHLGLDPGPLVGNVSQSLKILLRSWSSEVLVIFVSVKFLKEVKD